jgi:FAD/FMN-containing dehydrogenase
MNGDELQKYIQGRVVTPSHPDFPTVRAAMVWNEVKPLRSPEIIVTVKNDDDIIQAVNFARDHHLRIAVHGGGHTWCGLAVREGGMTIDLSQLNDVIIDKKNRKAIIQPVISNQELAHRLSQYDLAFPIGHCPTVKASGYLLNGGMSWNLSHWGPACISVEAIECITAEGKKIIANHTDYSDLFWAARGVGPGMFAVATRYHLTCYPLPKAIMTSTYYYSLDLLSDVVKEVTTLGREMPSIVELSIFLIKAPPELLDQCKSSNSKLCMITAVAFADTKEEAVTALQRLETGKLVTKCLAKKINEASSFEKLSEISGITWPERHRNLCENQSSKANPVDILMAMRDKIIDAPSSKSVIVFCQSTGQHDLLEENPNIALSMAGQSYGGIWAIWDKEEDDAANRQWQDETAALLKPFTYKHYIGETDIVQDPSRIKNSYTTEKWEKLERIKTKYDPAGLFFGYSGGI